MPVRRRTTSSTLTSGDIPTRKRNDRHHEILTADLLLERLGPFRAAAGAQRIHLHRLADRNRRRRHRLRRPAREPRSDDGPSELLAILRQYEALLNRIQVIAGYASLWFYSDTGSQEALTFRNRVRQASTAASNRILFFTLWWREPAGRRGLAPAAQRVRARGDYRHYLQRPAALQAATRSTRSPSRSSTSRTRTASAPS